jgi:hypothetical protein
VVNYEWQSFRRKVLSLRTQNECKNYYSNRHLWLAYNCRSATPFPVSLSFSFTRTHTLPLSLSLTLSLSLSLPVSLSLSLPLIVYKQAPPFPKNWSLKFKNKICWIYSRILSIGLFKMNLFLHGQSIRWVHTLWNSLVNM